MSRRSDGFDFTSPKTQRSMSMNSDRPSLSGLSTMPTGIHPAPAYVAASAASQMVTDNHIGEDEDVNAVDDGALFSEGALASLNAFLDHLLYNFLASAKSASLASLRPAVTDVLKTRLARDAIATADEDLSDLLSGTEDDEELAYIQNGDDVNGKWDLEMVWRRTRLRVMVYIRLGEMEDEDEERYLEEDEYFSSDSRRFSRNSGLVSWAAAIFLTSVIEYMAEQTIICAGKAAYNRSLKRKATDVRSSMEIENGQARIIVEESDMEKVALDSALSRLWRTWRRRLRQPSSGPSTPAQSRLGHRPSSVTSPKRRNASFDGTDGGFSETDDYRTSSALVEEQVPTVPGNRMDDPEDIPLPMGDRDVDEIEVPGLAKTFEDESEEDEDDEPPRRASFVTLMRSKDDSIAVQDDEIDERPILKRVRSRSLPVPGAFTTENLREQLYDKAAPSVVKQCPEDEKAEAVQKEIRRDSEKQTKRRSLLATGASMAAAGAAAAYGAVMGTRKQATSPATDDDQSAEARTREIHDSRDAQVHDSTRISETCPEDALELTRHESGSSYSTDMSFPFGPKATEVAFQNEKVPLEEKSVVSPLPKEVGPANSSGRPVSPPSRTGNKSTRIPIQKPDSPDADDDARKLERIAKATAPAAAVSAVTGAGVAAVAARKHNAPPPKAIAQPWDEPSAEQFLAAESLKGPVGSRSPLGGPKTSRAAVAHPPRDQEIPTATPAREKLRRDPQADSQALAPAKLLNRDPSSESVVSSNSDLKPQPLSIKTNEKVPSESPAEWSTRVSPPMRRPARGSKSSIDSLGDQHAQVTPISASSARRRDFESLVRGEETMKYTLTPQGMRDLEDSPNGSVRKEAEHPRYPSKSTKQIQEQSRTSGSASSSQHTPDRKYPARTSSVTNKASSSQPSDVGQSNTPLSTDKPTSRPIQKNYLGTKQGLIAREPQVQTVSTKDLADFFQTTAPVKEPDPVLPLLLNRSQSQPATSARRQLDSSNTSTKNERSSNNIRSPNRGSMSSPKAGAPSAPVTTPKKMHLQAREAVAPSSGSNDLIDFLRKGPPSDPNGITSTSNQSQNFNPRSMNRDSSTVGTLSSSRTSANSRTALMPQQNGGSSSTSSITQPTSNSTKQTLAPPGAGNSLGANAPDLGRKRYRNKDPYAIDFDDEDEDLLTALPHTGRPQRQEESLIDFLNSVEPPSLNAPKPILEASQNVGAKGKKEQANTSKKAETSTLKKADPSTTKISPSSKPQTPVTPTQEKRQSNPATSGFRQNGALSRDGILSTTTMRAGATPSQAGIPSSQPMNPLSMNSPSPPQTRSSSISHPIAPAPDITAANKPRPKIEARSPGVAKGAGSASRLDAFHTDDLADFLRSSGPPDGGAGAPAPSVGRAREDAARKTSASSAAAADKRRRFPWQRKTYLDMP